MDKSKLIAEFGDLTLESFRLNGRLLAKGDEIAAELGMTSARWQVLGTLVIADEGITVAEIARRMGLARQSVQRVTHDLLQEKLVRYADNPRHPRWQLVVPTARGLKVRAQLEERRRAWSSEVVTEMSLAELQTAAAVLRKLRNRLTAETTEATL